MTETQKQSAIDVIKNDATLPLPVKARKIEQIIDTFNAERKKQQPMTKTLDRNVFEKLPGANKRTSSLIAARSSTMLTARGRMRSK